MSSIDKIIAKLINSNTSKKVVLAMGAKPHERAHFQFNEMNGFNEPPIIIYFDNNEPYPSTGVRSWTEDDIIEDNEEYLIGDWKNRDYLNEISNKLTDKFDLIVTDKGCAHLLKLDTSLLNSYNKMLKNNGFMIFDYFLGCVIFNIDFKNPELIQECIFPKNINYLDYLKSWSSYHNILLDIVSNDVDEFKYVPERQNINSNGFRVQNNHRLRMIKT